MNDYSCYKNGLDIVEALTKRLDRLTGFDSELDNILGGHGECDSGHVLCQNDLDRNHLHAQILKKNSSSSSQTTTKEIKQSGSPVGHNNYNATGTSTVTNKSLKIEQVNSVPRTNWSSRGTTCTLIPSASTDKQESSPLDGRDFLNICKSHQLTDFASHKCSPKIFALPKSSECFSLESHVPEISVLRRFLSIPSDGETSDSSVGLAEKGDANPTQLNEHLLNDHCFSAEVLKTSMTQHILEIKGEDLKLGRSSYEHLKHGSPDLRIRDSTKDGEPCRLVPFDIEGAARTCSGNYGKNYSLSFPTMADVYEERTKEVFLNFRKKYLHAESYECSSAPVETSSAFETSPDGFLEMSNTTHSKYSSLMKGNDSTLYKGVEKSVLNFPEEISISKEDNVSNIMSIDPSSESVVVDPESFYTASECSCASTPSFLTARDRESVLSWRSLSSEVGSVGRSYFHRKTPVMKDLSEIYMTKKTFINDFQKSFDSIKSNLLPGENTDQLVSTLLHQHSRSEEEPTQCNHLQNTSQGNSKEQSCFTTLEEVKQKRYLKYSPLDGCTMTRDELSNEHPTHPSLDVHLSDKTLVKDVRDQLGLTDASSPLREPLNSFSTMEEVRDIQHIKLSPLEGCSLNSLVTTTEFSPHEYMTLSSGGQSMTSSESKQTTMMMSSEQSTELPIVITDDSLRQMERRNEWNRDETSMFNPDIAQPSNSFSTIEEVRDIQHIKLSPLEGCSLNILVTATEFSPHEYMTLSSGGQSMTSSEPKQTTMMMSSEQSTEFPIVITDDSLRQMEGRNEWNRDETSMFNPDISQPLNSFSTMEEVKDIQHIKLSPLEGCSLNSLVTTTEFSPHEYMTLSSGGQSMTSSESKQTTMMMSSEQTTELPIVITDDSLRQMERRNEWNKDEMSMFNPNISQPSNSFSTIEEVRDIQHIKLSPLEGCSLNSLVTTTEFSPHEYLLFSRADEVAYCNELDRTS